MDDQIRFHFRGPNDGDDEVTTMSKSKSIRLTSPMSVQPLPSVCTQPSFSTLADQQKCTDCIKRYKANNPERWLTTQPDTPTSCESHASFWNDLVEDLNEECIFQKLVEYENFTQQKLEAQIQGNWTRRFVQKRTKPKMINSLHRERIDVLIKMVEDDRVVWKLREIVYINLALRVRLHEEITDGWVEFLDKTQDFEQYARHNMIPEIQHFHHMVATADNPKSQEHYMRIAIALNAMFSGRLSRYDGDGESSSGFPDTNCIRTLHGHLGGAKNALFGVFWDTHDNFYVIDGQVDQQIFESLKKYSDFAQNPLIKQQTKNFRESMCNLQTIYRAANYCRRRMQSMMGGLEPDFKNIELTVSSEMMKSFKEWIEFMIVHWDFDAEEWNEMKLRSEQGIKLQGEPEDELVIDLRSIKQSERDMLEFIKDELAEVGRLMRAQVEWEGTIQVVDLLKVVQSGPYASLIPVTVPPKLEEAIETQRQRLYRNSNAEAGDPRVEAEMVEYLDRVAKSVQTHALLSNQGILYLFASKLRQSCLLTIQMAALDNVHVDGKMVLLHHEGYAEVVLEFPSEQNVNEWLPFAAKFCR